MTNKEAVNWIINLSADIGKSEHRELWHYEQALYEIREMLESAQQWIPCSEQLPKKYQYVLVTYNGLDGRRLVVVTNWNSNAWIESNSVAWIPVPEPYKEVDE